VSDDRTKQAQSSILGTEGLLLHAGDNDYMEVTQWSNGEGYDICIDRKNGRDKFSLTFGEFDLLTVLMNWKG
jgi:hypothetical protein